MAVFNLAALGSNTAGGWLYERLGKALPSAHWAMGLLILLGTATTLACWPLLAGLETGNET